MPLHLLSRRALLEALHEPKTDRVNFTRIGSFLFAAFSWMVTLLLGVLCVRTL